MEEHQEQLWTVDELAAWLRVTPVAARAILRRRELPEGAVLKIGRRVRIRAELVRGWILKKQAA